MNMHKNQKKTVVITSTIAFFLASFGQFCFAEKTLLSSNDQMAEVSHYDNKSVLNSSQDAQAGRASELIKAGIPGVKVQNEKAKKLDGYQKVKWAFEAVMAPTRAASKKVWYVYSPDKIEGLEVSNTRNKGPAGVALIPQDEFDTLNSGSSKEISLRSLSVIPATMGSSTPNEEQTEALEQAFANAVAEASSKGYFIASDFEIVDVQFEGRLLGQH